jgi:hypothetical protein
MRLEISEILEIRFWRGSMRNTQGTEVLNSPIQFVSAERCGKLLKSLHLANVYNRKMAGIGWIMKVSVHKKT